MLKIELINFFPIKDDSDFKIVLKPLSFLDKQEVLIAATQNQNSGGPEDFAKTSDTFKSHVTFVEKMFEKGVLKVSGCEFDGKAVTDWRGLLDIAPKEVVDSIIAKLNETAELSEAERKNS